MEARAAALVTAARGEDTVPPSSRGHRTEVSFQQAFKDFREQWVDHGEREYIKRLLARHRRNVAAAADEAEVDRTYIYRLIKKHAL
jgi:transcriptional regulator with PAS, ATPase and Fis domain